MAGIIFYTTSDLTMIVDFYINVIGCKKWISQKNVEILSHGNLLIGFHETGNTTGDTLTTFFYGNKAKVDEMYSTMNAHNLVESPPQENPTYSIYNFFAKDPEGRKLEFQSFLHNIPTIEYDFSE